MGDVVANFREAVSLPQHRSDGTLRNELIQALLDTKQYDEAMKGENKRANNSSLCSSYNTASQEGTRTPRQARPPCVANKFSGFGLNSAARTIQLLFRTNQSR